MKKKQRKQKKLDPFKVFIEMRKQKKNQVYYAKKFRRTKGAITHAFQGKSKSLLTKIAKELEMIQ